MAHEVALAHDYVTQRGGAERVALWLAEAFPGAPMYTTLYHPHGTFPEFGNLDLRTSVINRVHLLRRQHRLAFPLLAPAVDFQRVNADILLTSSTGWAHGYRGAGKTVVYCHAPARWLYQRERYLGSYSGAGVGGHARRVAATAALATLSPALRRWDFRAAQRADTYLANSTVTQRAIKQVYGIDAEVLPPPPAMLPEGPEVPVPGITPGFVLCVARLMPYKNVDVVIEAAKLLAGPQLVVVGEGPERARLTSLAGNGSQVRLLGRVTDDELRWLYRHTSALVGASFEDYGLSPLEAGAFGRPSVVLRDGGYLDTVVDGVSGTFFDAPRPELIARAIEEGARAQWSPDKIRAHVAGFGLPRFISRLRSVVHSAKSSSSGGSAHPS